MSIDSLQLIYWHWWILALVLIFFELFVSGAFFLWMGISAFVTGLFLYVYPAMSWHAQAFWFSILSIASVLIWRRVQKSRPVQSDRPKLNRRGEQYIGRVFNLDEPIVNGSGKIRADGAIWRVSGEDCDLNVRVRVTGIQGTLLEVELAAEVGK